ncbi:DUF3618 domain-containing protein [Isoptericola sp. b441]|uniref:DUF3618 domain-containing protein n=1 Tax=Actinotalea lenta TaxID=3064654 RepID=A0ABT9D744_9CELL|nr:MULTISPECIES: DUF3618 domain-containing protein [unclassified Isoptericola]MDO8105878.1 DUF3618 domain-containing protein [Isoptericola sp. b441]MDO8122594.1 DUF3618 domain-containing protein [Isoptericola sp. b490]
MSAAEDIQADITRTRSELQATVDELADRLDPKANVLRALEEAKVALADVQRRVQRTDRGPEDREPTTTGWVVLGVGAAATAAIVTTVVRKI